MTAAAELVVLGNAQREIERPMSAMEIRAGVNLIQDVMRSVMKKDVHYGTIPGTPKPTLYQPGADKILSTFRIAVEPIVEDLSSYDEARFRVTVRATLQSTGTFLGAGVGECSSSEEKYCWRGIVHQKEWDATPEDRRRIKFNRKGEETRQVRTNPADMRNTVLKMATKRGKIAVTLTVTAASDIFAQDIEDLPEEIQHELGRDEGGSVEPLTHVDPKPSQRPPQGPGIRVESVRVAKTGTNDNGDWSLFVVKLSDGNEYKTFDNDVAGLAKASIQKSAAVAFAFEETEKGRKLTSLEVIG